MSTRHEKVALSFAVSIMAVVLLGSTAMAQVYTDPVGFVKVDVVRNGLTMVSVPLNAEENTLTGGDHCIGAMLKDALVGGITPATGDVVWKWDPGTQSYRSAFLTSAIHPYPDTWFETAMGSPTDMTFDAAECMWIERKSAGPDPATVTFYGWAPMGATTTLTFVQGLKMFNWPYPTSLALNASDLGTVAGGGITPAIADVVWEWDAVGRTYASAFLAAAPHPLAGQWVELGVATTMQFAPGKAFWLERKGASPFSWVCTRPY